MPQFFLKTIDQHQFTGPRSSLEAERQHFKQNRVSGILEVQPGPDGLEVLILGDGEEIGAYRLVPNPRTKLAPAEIGADWDDRQVLIRSAALPDQASRAIWQALEFPLETREEVQGLAGWKAFLDRSYSARLSGMVGVASEFGDGFVYLHEGLLVSNETVFCSADGFTNNMAVVEKFLDTRDQLVLYKADPATQAYQCTLLRVGVLGWGKRILANYKDMVGQKLLQILNANLNAMLMHRQSNIYLADIDIIDNHFFCECKTAALEYQALLLNMSQFIGRVIGGMVTRRILHTTFERLALCEQEALTTNTLAPDALLR